MTDKLTWEERALLDNARQHAMDIGFTDFNLVDMISKRKGWLPLELGEHMTVRFHDKQYKIERIQ